MTQRGANPSKLPSQAEPQRAPGVGVRLWKPAGGTVTVRQLCHWGNEHY